MFWPAADRVAEGQRIGAGAARIGRGAAVVERQRRGAAGNRHRLAQVDRQRHHAAGREVARSSRDPDAGRQPPTIPKAPWCRSERPAGVSQHSVRLAALPAPSCDGRAVEVDRCHRQRRGVLAGRHRVAEGQRIGAGAARIGRGAAIIERQRRGAARNRHCLAQVERQGDDVAGFQIADRSTRSDCHRADRRRRGVDLRAALGQAGQRQVGGIAGTVLAPWRR